MNLINVVTRHLKHFPCLSWSLMLLVYALSCFGQEKLTLKAKQEEVLTNLYDVRDVFAWFPTGYGKSMCYQLLPFLLDFNLKRTCSSRVKRSVVIGISSLMSLMVDQVSSLLHSAARWKNMNNIIMRVIEHACALLPLQCFSRVHPPSVTLCLRKIRRWGRG